MLWHLRVWDPSSVSSKLNKTVLGYFDLINKMFDYKNTEFSGWIAQSYSYNKNSGTQASTPPLQACAWLLRMNQCYILSQNISQVTPNFNHFHRLKKYFLDQSIWERKTWFWKQKHWQEPFAAEQAAHRLRGCGDALAKTSLRSPRKLYSYIIKKCIYRMKASNIF